MLRAACKGRDRYLAFAKAKRLAMRGGLVVTDRFPIANITLMDRPVIGRINRGRDVGGLTRLLMALEHSFYDRITPPDVLIILKVDPEVAVRRKTDEDATEVRIRSTEVWETDWQQTPAHVIDGHQSPADVLSELKSLIWSEL
jgi:thymidylate kinase